MVSSNLFKNVIKEIIQPIVVSATNDSKIEMGNFINIVNKQRER